MNFQNIFNQIEQVDPEFYARTDTRRESLKKFAGIGKKLALTAIPFALGSLFKKAYGTPPSSNVVLDVLNYALTLEYLEAEFYANSLTALPGMGAPTAAQNAIKVIADHEAAHVTLLKNVINSLGSTPVPKPTFDFTAGGAFNDVYTNYDLFLAVAQTFEDTGVRAYKGRAAEIVGGGDILEAALNIHSVEARHASHIRQMRRARSSDTSINIKPWITLNETAGIGSAVQASYNGEENVVQATVNIANLPNVSGTIGMTAASESFDEGLTKDQVLAIVAPFIVG